MGGRIPSPTNAERLPDQIQGYSSKVVVMVGMVGSVVLVVLVVGYDGFDTNYSTNTISCTHLDIVHSSQYV